MRILLAIHNAYTDATSGAAQSMHIMMQWLAEGGHQCRVLGTARFDAKAPASIEDHLALLDVPLQRHPPSKVFVRSVKKPPNMVVGRPTVDFVLNGVPVTMLMTKGGTRIGRRPVRNGAVSVSIRRDPPDRFEPQVLVTYGGYPVVQEVMRRARLRGVVCVFVLYNLDLRTGNGSPTSITLLTCSPYLSDVYHELLGLRSTGIETPTRLVRSGGAARDAAVRDLREPVPARRVAPVRAFREHAGNAPSRYSGPRGPIGDWRGSDSNALPGFDCRKYPQIVASPADATTSRLLSH